MNYLRSQRGSSLILVLITIVIISILAITIFSGTSSNFLQIKQSESSIQATSMAKIGMPHYQNYIAEQFNLLLAASSKWIVDNKKDVLDAEIIDQCGYVPIGEDYDEEKFLAEFQICARQIVMPYLVEALEANVSNFFNGTRSYKGGYSIQNEFYEVYMEDSPQLIEDGIRFIITSEGTDVSGTKNQELQFQFIIPYSGGFRIEYIRDDDDGPRPPLFREFPSGNDIADPDPNNTYSVCSNNQNFNNTRCRFTGVLYNLGSGNKKIDNSILKVRGSLQADGLNNSVDSTIYITQNITVTGNANNFTRVNLHVDGNANIANLNNLTNSFVEIKGLATLGHLQGMNGSTIFIGGKSNIATSNNNQLDMNNNSILYILDDTTITGKVTVRSGSIICVNGRLDIAQEPTWDRSPGSGIFALETNNTNYVQTGKNFRNACFNSVLLENLKLVISPDFDFEWDINNADIRY